MVCGLNTTPRIATQTTFTSFFRTILRQGATGRERSTQRDATGLGTRSICASNPSNENCNWNVSSWRFAHRTDRKLQPKLRKTINAARSVRLLVIPRECLVVASTGSMEMPVPDARFPLFDRLHDYNRHDRISPLHPPEQRRLMRQTRTLTRVPLDATGFCSTPRLGWQMSTDSRIQINLRQRRYQSPHVPQPTHFQPPAKPLSLSTRRCSILVPPWTTPC